jgi:hypothetical protein
MAVRTSMADLITQVRFLIGDPSGATAVFTDTELQTCLDNNAVDVLYEPLRPIPTIAAGGATTYLTWDASAGWWESSEVLTDGSYNVLTATTSDRQRGRWTFAATQSAVLLKGARYDVYLAAAEVVDVWIAKVKLEFDFTADGASFQRSQKIKALVDLGQSLRSRAGSGGVLTAQMVRWDA